MNKLVGLVISTIAFAAPIAADASPVIWSFYETAITSCNSPRDCMLPRQPFVLMTLTLPGPTSSGTGDLARDGDATCLHRRQLHTHGTLYATFDSSICRRCEQSRRNPLLRWRPRYDLRFQYFLD